MSQYISPNSTACIKQAMSVLFSFHYPGKKKNTLHKAWISEAERGARG